MDKTIFYKTLDIDKPSEFCYYENLEALLECDEYIEANLIYDLFKEIDSDILAEAFSNYFEDFLRVIPDEENELYILVDNIGRLFEGMLSSNMEAGDIRSLSEELVKFRKWYVLDKLAFNMLNGTEVSILEARYDILSAKLLNEDCRYDFRTALDYDLEGFDVRFETLFEDDDSNIDSENDSENYSDDDLEYDFENDSEEEEID